MPVRKYTCDEIENMISGLAFPEYRELKECRDVVDDCLAGQRTIKEKTKYALDIYTGLFSLGEPKITLPSDGKLDFIIKNASVYNDSLKMVQMGKVHVCLVENDDFPGADRLTKCPRHIRIGVFGPVHNGKIREK